MNGFRVSKVTVDDEVSADSPKMFRRSRFNWISVLWGCAWLLSKVAAEEEPVCAGRQYLDQCLAKLPELVDQSLLRRMPVSEAEIESLCRGFQIGMQCINKYSSKCLEPAGKQFLDVQISGARRVFNSLCNDEEFKAEYLLHTQCLKGTQKNWESCVSQFTQLVREEIQKKNYSRDARIMQTCCAIHGFSRCIYVPGRLKCRKEAALFLLKIAEMSIDQREYLQDCHSINNYKVCSGCGVRLTSSLLMLFLVLHRLWTNAAF